MPDTTTNRPTAWVTVLVAAAIAGGACGSSQSTPARSLPAPVASAPAPATGAPTYDRRRDFGSWTRVLGSRCRDTARFVLERDSGPQGVDSDGDGCRDNGTVVDAYTGQPVPANAVQIDHVLPLAVAFREGAWNWSREKRVLLANDQANLRAVLGSVNQAKGDLTPAEMLSPARPGHRAPWKPPTPDGRCAFATIYRATADRWSLPIPAGDDAALRIMAADCGRS